MKFTKTPAIYSRPTHISTSHYLTSHNPSRGAGNVIRQFRSYLIIVMLLVVMGSTSLWAQAATTTPTYNRIWSDSSIPKNITDDDNQSVELGMKFQSKVAGKVRAVKFYKSATNTGTHVGTLWDKNGNRLASVTFKNETKSGWQTANFPRSIKIAANTTYIISYHAPHGHYSADTGYFNKSTVNGPLTALASSPNGLNGPNGVYAYGSSPSFPTSSYKASNYWVDVLVTTRTVVTPQPVPTTAAPIATTTKPVPTTTTPVPTTTKPVPTTTTSVPTTTKPVPTTTTPPSQSGPVSFGWQLTANNTGLAGVGINRNSLPAFNGSISSGQTISNVSITSCIDLHDKTNVTLNRVYIHPSGCQVALTIGPGMIIKDSDIDGTAMATGQERYGIGGQRGVGTRGNYTIQRVHITGMAVGMELDSDDAGIGTVTDTYIHGMISTNGAHLDAFTRRAGTGPLNIVRSRFAVDYVGPGGSYATGAFFVQDTYGVAGGVSLKDSYLEGDGFPICLEANHGYSLNTLSFNNVRIRATEKSPTTRTGPVGITEWTNVFVYSATAANNAGAVIGKP